MAKITIFGLAGTGTTTVGKMLAGELGYEFQSTGNMFRAKAKELGLDLNVFEKLAEGDSKYDIELDQKVADYGKTHDNFIFESRLAWYFIPDSIKICLTCDEEESIKRIAGRESKDFNTAAKETKFRADTILGRYKKYYGIEKYPDNDFFNIVVDTTHITPGEIVKIIISKLKF